MTKIRCALPAPILLGFLLPVLSPIYARPVQAQEHRAQEHGGGIQALFLLPRTLGANYFLLRDAIEEYGWSVTRTAVVDTVIPCDFWGRLPGAIPLIPDLPLAAVGAITDWDCLVLASSPGNANPVPDPYGDIIGSPAALDLIRAAVNAGRPVFTTCSGSRVLAAADVLRGRRVVGSPRFRAEYEAAGAEYLGNERNDTAPLISGPVITSSRGQTYNLSQVMAIATLIEDRQPTGGKPSPGTEYLVESPLRLAGGQTLWARTIGGPGADGARALIATSDGGFLLTGYTFAPGETDADLLLVKTDREGRPQWSLTVSGAGTEYGNACAEVADGFLVTGFTTSWGAGGRDLVVLKVDHLGREQWSHTYGGGNRDVGQALLPLSDGTIAVCGFTASFGAGEEDVWVLKLTSEGEEIWSRTYGGARIDMGNSIQPAPDGGFLIGATSLSYGGPNSDFWLLRTDARGDTLWTRNYPARGPAGHAFDWCRSSTATCDGGVLLVGYADCNDLMDTVAIRADAGGNESWQRYFGANPFYDYGFSAAETPDGGFLVAGLSKRVHAVPRAGEDIHDNEISLAKLSAGGDILWQRRFGGEGSDRASAVVITPEGDIVLAGQTSSGGAGSFDLCLIKLAGR